MRIFVVWDSTIHNFASNLRVARDELRPTIDLVFLEGQVRHGSVPAIVREKITEADQVLAVLDRPNANVGFEIGLALGSRRPLAVCAADPQRPPWMDDRAPLRGEHVNKGVEDVDALEKVARTALDPAQEPWQVCGEPPEAGSGDLLVCPGVGPDKAFYKALMKVHPWKEVPADRWSLADLPRRLDGVGRVFWVMLQPKDPGQRDGVQAANLAIVAGYAAARGVPVLGLWQQGTRPVMDAFGHTETFTDVDDLVARVQAHLAPSVADGPVGPALIRRYRHWLRERHARLGPLLGDGGQALEQVYVELAVETCDPDEAGRRKPGRSSARMTLRALMESSCGSTCARQAIHAEPGAGKTTAVRHLAWRLADEPDGPVPLVVPLHAWASKLKEAADPLAFVEEQTGFTGLADALRDLPPGRLWLLLDGLDEVPERHRLTVLSRLQRLSADAAWAGVPMVLTGRSVAFEHGELKGEFPRAELRPLEREQQQALLRTLVGDDLAVDIDAAIHADLPGRAILKTLAGNPLMLTLIARVAEHALPATGKLPVGRVEVMQAAIDLLLRHGNALAHQGADGKAVGMRNVAVTRTVLARVARRLQQAGGEVWTRDQVQAELVAVRVADPALAAVMNDEWGQGTGPFLDELDQRSGLLGALDGEAAQWRFLHGSVRELLVAEALVEEGEEAVERFVAEWEQAVQAREAWEEDDAEEAPPDPARWGEVIAMLCSLAEDPGPLLLRIAARSNELLLRALKTFDGLQPERVLELLFGREVRHWDDRGGVAGQWDGDDLVPALQATGAPPWRLHELLLACVVPGLPTLLAGIVWEALERLCGPPDREEFFRAWGRALPEAVDLRDMVRIPGGTFWMGSPAEEPGRDDDEGPTHQVTLTAPFLLGRTTVTRAQYGRFDPQHTCSGGPDHPVTLVSWYEARLYAAWLGGGLPTEAEWEYACRAGTQTAYSFGKDPKQLHKYGWFEENSNHETHPVGERMANPWGLHDMHGNVMEWCDDDWRTYVAAPQVDPRGAPGGQRAVRGGTAWHGAGWCRSACRGWWGPGNQGVNVGFRVRFPAPAPDHGSDDP